MDSHYTLLNMFNLLIIWKVVLVLFKIQILVHQISLWLTSLFVIILYITWHSAVLKLSIYTSALGALIIFFVKSERLNDLTVICMHCPFLKYDILFILFIFFYKNVPISEFCKKKEKKIHHYSMLQINLVKWL